MNYDSQFNEYVSRLGRGGIGTFDLAVEAYKHAVSHQRYQDAALIVMLACRRLGTYESSINLLGRFSALDSWEALLQVKFFATWVVESRLEKAVHPRLRHDDREQRWIESENESEEELLSTCRSVFSDLEAQLRQYKHHDFGGMNLLFFLNRSRRANGSSRIDNPAAFGLSFISPTSTEERDSILGRVEQGAIRVRSVSLGTDEPQDPEDQKNVLDRLRT